MRRLLTVIASGALMVGMLAGPALAHHDHHMENPSGCHTIPVGHQDHSDPEDEDSDRKDSGNKFHGAAHKGPATDDDGRLGKGKSQATVAGGACPDAE